MVFSPFQVKKDKTKLLCNSHFHQLCVILYEFSRIYSKLLQDKKQVEYVLFSWICCAMDKVGGLMRERATLYQFPCRTHASVHLKISFL